MCIIFSHPHTSDDDPTARTLAIREGGKEEKQPRLRTLVPSAETQTKTPNSRVTASKKTKETGTREPIRKPDRWWTVRPDSPDGSVKTWQASCRCVSYVQGIHTATGLSHLDQSCFVPRTETLPPPFVSSAQQAGTGGVKTRQTHMCPLTPVAQSLVHSASMSSATSLVPYQKARA